MQKLRHVGRRSALRRAMDMGAGPEAIEKAALEMIVAWYRGFNARKAKRAEQTGSEDEGDEPHPPPVRASEHSFGGPPINGGPGAAAGPQGEAYWRQRTQVAVGDSHAAASSWAALLRAIPSWGVAAT